MGAACGRRGGHWDGLWAASPPGGAGRASFRGPALCSPPPPHCLPPCRRWRSARCVRGVGRGAGQGLAGGSVVRSGPAALRLPPPTRALLLTLQEGPDALKTAIKQVRACCCLSSAPEVADASRATGALLPSASSRSQATETFTAHFLEEENEMLPALLKDMTGVWGGAGWLKGGVGGSRQGRSGARLGWHPSGSYWHWLRAMPMLGHQCSPAARPSP